MERQIMRNTVYVHLMGRWLLQRYENIIQYILLPSPTDGSLVEMAASSAKLR